MKKDLLIVYTTIGPTFRERSVINIIDNLESYSQFDVLLLTDYQEDPIYDKVKHLDNIIIKDINDLRKNYSWSIEHEPLPIKTLNEEEYATYVVHNNIGISYSLWRFAFLLEGIESYNGILFCNTDVVFTGDNSEIVEFQDSIKNFTKSTVFGNGGVIYTEQFKNQAEFLFNRNNFQRKKDYLWASDGNFFCYCFKTKQEIRQFFEILNSIIYTVLIDKLPELSDLGHHGIWLVNNELIQSFAHAAIDVECTLNDGIYRIIQMMRYPEDRFWNWGIWLPEQRMCTTVKGKRHFIETNYNLLKNYYEFFGQQWNYDKL